MMPSKNIEILKKRSRPSSSENNEEKIPKKSRIGDDFCCRELRSSIRNISENISDLKKVNYKPEEANRHEQIITRILQKHKW